MREYGSGTWVNGEWRENNAPEEPTQQEKLVANVAGALKDETPVGDGWTLIGGIRLGTAITIKADDGTPLFDLALKVRPGAVQDYDRNGVYPVVIKRDADGLVDKISVDFTSEMDYSNQASVSFEKLIKMGVAKPIKKS